METGGMFHILNMKRKDERKKDVGVIEKKTKITIALLALVQSYNVFVPIIHLCFKIMKEIRNTELVRVKRETWYKLKQLKDKSSLIRKEENKTTFDDIIKSLLDEKFNKK